MSEFNYQPIFEKTNDSTEYRLITKEHVSTETFQGRELLVVETEGIEKLSEQAFDDVSHLLRPEHLKGLTKILEDSEASENDKYVATELLRNAVIASHRTFPSCQDTGTAIILANKGENVFVNGNDEKALSKGVFNIYQKRTDVKKIRMFLKSVLKNVKKHL